ncbi:hypothetical protein HY546_01140 [archaeon]|nr:hypothetical protein [archaeon]
MAPKLWPVCCAVAIVAAITLWFSFPYFAPPNPNEFAPPNEPVSAKFLELSEHGNSACFGQQTVLAKQDGERLTGSCCGQMNQHRYAEQVEGLKKHAAIAEIPADPYDIPIPLAKKLIGFKNSIALSSEQQLVYDKAANMSHEGGPCCCRCWRWDAYEGLAKFLITQHDFTARQVAEVWDLSDGCGGEGHAPGLAHAE